MKHIIILLALVVAAEAQTIPKNQRDALNGANGQAPSGNNRYVCDQDPRLAETGLGTVVVQLNGVTVGTANALNFEGDGVESVAMDATILTKCNISIVSASGGTPLGYTSNVTVEQTGNNTVHVGGEYAVLADDAGTSRTSVTTINVTADVSASVGANGPDRSGIDTSSRWFDVYLIHNGSTLSSLIVPAGSTPVMPSGYTMSLFVSPARNNSGSNLVPFIYDTQKKTFDYRDDDSNLLAVNGGTATSWTAIDMSALCPPRARWAYMLIQLSGTSNGGAQMRETGVSTQIWDVASGTARYNHIAMIPISQARSIDYQLSGAGSPSLIAAVMGFKMGR